MSLPQLLVVLLVLVAATYAWGRRWALSVPSEGRARHSLPHHYGALVALYAMLPALLAILLYLGLREALISALVVRSLPPELGALPPEQLALVMNSIRNLAAGQGAQPAAAAATTAVMEGAAHYTRLSRSAELVLPLLAALAAAGGLLCGWRRLAPATRARRRVEAITQRLFILCASVAVLTTAGIVLSVLFESLRFFERVPLTDFLFGLEWSPQTAIREEQVGSSGSFGVVPLFAGTLLITCIAMALAAPVGLLTAIYLAEYATAGMRAVIKPVLELLAGIPTVVYGFFAALTVAPLVADGASFLGLEAASESALAAGLVMGVMIIPFVSSLSDDVISAVPRALRDGSYGLGATHAETIRKVVLPAALPGIAGSLLLAVSRAIGETMIVVMAAGLAANLSANPLQATTTVTVQIVSLLTGDQEFDSSKTLAAFALGLLLFLATFCMNLLALVIVRRYREQYE